MFELDAQNCQLKNFNARVELVGEEKRPAADLQLLMNVENTFLAHFAPTLRAMLYHQQGIGNDLANATHAAPNLRYPKLAKLSWDDEVIGARVVIAHGLGGKSDLEFAQCKVNKFRLEPQEGGTCIVEFRVQCYPDEKQAGKLFQLQGLDCDVTVEPPEAEPNLLDGTSVRAELDKPPNTAGEEQKRLPKVH